MSNLRFKVRCRAGLKLAICFAIAFALETTALVVLFGNDDRHAWTWLMAGMLHFLAAASFNIFRHRPYALGGLGYFLPRMSALLTFFIPGLGLIGIFSAVVAAKLIMRSKGMAEDYEKKEFYISEVQELMELEDHQDFLRDELNIQPIVDIIKGDDVELKRGAIRVLKRMGNAESVALLRQCLTDPVPEIRFYAHTALDRLEESYNQMLQEAEDSASWGEGKDLKQLAKAYLKYARSGLVEKEENMAEGFKDVEREAMQASGEGFKDLADAYLKYVRTGLPEQGVLNHYLLRAANAATQAREKIPQDMDLVRTLAEISLELHDYDSARNYYSEMFKSGEMPVESSLGLCRVLYDTGDMKSLKKCINHMQNVEIPEGTPQEIVDQFEFWRGKGAINDQGA